MVLASTATFNVGGTFYTTSKDTLLKSPSSRLALIVRGVLPCVQDAQGVYFIDRDPKHFQLLLNWLRDGWCSLPATPDALMELLVELRAYNMSDMEAWMRTQAVVAGASASAAARSSLSPTSPSSPSWLPTSSPTRDSHLPGGGAAAGGSGYGPRSLATSPAGVRASYHATLGAGPYLTSLFAASASHPASSPPPMLPPQPGGSSGEAVGTGGGVSASDAGARQAAFRAAFKAGTSPGPPPAPVPAYALPPQQGAEPGAPGGGGQWTAKYLATNDGLRAVVNALLELAFLAPHRSLHVGKVAITITAGACDHDKPSSLVGGSMQQLRAKGQVVRVRGLSTGWACEFPIRPGCDITLFEKYHIAEYVQDNWFVLCAVLRDQFGILLEEGGEGAAGVAESAAGTTTAVRSSGRSTGSTGPIRSACPACARTTLSVTLHKIV